jgi:ferredoxin, 2Fe-2S
MPRITFLPSGLTVDCQDGENILEVGRRHQVPIDTACIGRATCGLCRIRIVSGAESLDPYNKEEEKHLGNVYFITKIRLACQSIVRGDVTVELGTRSRSKK